MTPVLIGAVAVILAWFAAGSVWNVRKGSATLRWFKEGLPLLAEKTTLRWLGTTSVELVLARAKPPFERVTMVIFLEPRDVPWAWALARSRGRRDTLIVRALLKHAPPSDLEALDPASWSGRDALRRLETESWSRHEGGAPGQPVVFTKTADGLSRADALLALARESGMTVRRLSVRRQDPHLQIHVDLPAPPSPAAGFFQALRAIGERAAARL